MNACECYQNKECDTKKIRGKKELGCETKTEGEGRRDVSGALNEKVYTPQTKYLYLVV